MPLLQIYILTGHNYLANYIKLPLFYKKKLSKYENFLKRSEARLGTLLGANGAIYAIRKELYRPLLPDTFSSSQSMVSQVSVT